MLKAASQDPAPVARRRTEVGQGADGGTKKKPRDSDDLESSESASGLLSAPAPRKDD